MSPAREDYLIAYGYEMDLSELRRMSTVASVQEWINEHVGHGLPFEVRRVSLDENAIDVTDEFSPPIDDDASPSREREAARADHSYQMEREMA